jgi:uncharacterized protein YjbI with pentapeptide repeats
MPGGRNTPNAVWTSADLSAADLSTANLIGANLSAADLEGAALYETLFADVDLSTTKGLDGPSIIDHRTLQRSGRLSLAFLRGCGLPDKLIDYLPIDDTVMKTDEPWAVKLRPIQTGC